jgi:molybdopterin-guanine dinucleotide biosynthesis protein A
MGRFSAAIVAGGESTRMGEDKALITFQEMPLIEYIIRQVVHVADELIIIANTMEDYIPFELPIYPDVIHNVGNLGGIHSAIYHATYDLCLVLACDMPFINIPLIEYMLEAPDNYDAYIPRISKNKPVEPFRGVYRKTCINPLKKVMDSGSRRVVDFIENVKARYFEIGEIQRFDPDLISFFNINTPADLEKAKRIARSL